MPTARELLLQADALMRRNRERVREPEPDIPELTDEVDVPPGAQLARDAGDAARAAAPSVSEPAGAPGVVDEIPLEPHPDDSEVSRWLETDLGAPSVTGPAPDSIAVVPRPAPPAASPAAPPAGSGEFRQAAWPEAAPSMPSTASELLAGRVAGTLTGRPAEPPPESDPGFDAMLGATAAHPPLEPDLPRPVVPIEAEAPPPAVEAPAATIDAAREMEASAFAARVSPGGFEAGAGAPAEAREFVAEAAPLPEPVSASPATPPESPTESPASLPEPPVPLPAREGAAFDALAEEIRMQVLQRIDIFTDTGLQGELTERLKPIVDRASADLVATINREVGQLLRAYVAEAIEREIEKWRQANS